MADNIEESSAGSSSDFDCDNSDFNAEVGEKDHAANRRLPQIFLDTVSHGLQRSRLMVVQEHQK